MLAVRKGDASAFEVLMGRHIDALYRYALRLSFSPVRAEDLVQDTWLAVWEKAPSFKPAKAQFRTWVFRILYNRFVDSLRRTRHETLVPEVPEKPDANLAQNYADEEQRAWLYSKVSTLPEQQRAALLLELAQGFGNKDIAEIMGLSVRAVESLLARARKSLKDAYEKENTQQRSDHA